MSPNDSPKLSSRSHNVHVFVVSFIRLKGPDL